MEDKKRRHVWANSNLICGVTRGHRNIIERPNVVLPNGVLIARQYRLDNGSQLEDHVISHRPPLAVCSVSTRGGGMDPAGPLNNPS